VASGNYALTAHFSASAAKLDSLAAGTLAAPGSSRSYNLYVGRSQLMHLLLAAGAVGGPAVPGSAVKMTVRDQTGRVVTTFTATAGDTVSGPEVFLTPGAYVVQFTSVGTTGPALSMKLVGGVISDPIGPVLLDPTLAPKYAAPGIPGWFLYPGGILSPTSYRVSPRLIA
jgi:hypothetical protein